MDNQKLVIGVLGGMGTYATINFFRQYAEVFPAVKEWDRPRIIIDNNCTMPSRVRAFLYNENIDALVEQMASSIYHLIQAGATRIVLACNTSHLFLERVYEKLPESENYILNAIENCAEQLNLRGVRKVFLLASEGTIMSGIYEKFLAAKNIQCATPSTQDFSNLRTCIEAVKQNKFDGDVDEIFIDLIQRGGGC